MFNEGATTKLRLGQKLPCFLKLGTLALIHGCDWSPRSHIRWEESEESEPPNLFFFQSDLLQQSPCLPQTRNRQTRNPTTNIILILGLSLPFTVQ
jgi:hypothetical protein